MLSILKHLRLTMRLSLRDWDSKELNSKLFSAIAMLKCSLNYVNSKEAGKSWERWLLTAIAQLMSCAMHRHGNQWAAAAKSTIFNPRWRSWQAKNKLWTVNTKPILPSSISSSPNSLLPMNSKITKYANCMSTLRFLKRSTSTPSANWNFAGRTNAEIESLRGKKSVICVKKCNKNFESVKSSGATESASWSEISRKKDDRKTSGLSTAIN